MISGRYTYRSVPRQRDGALFERCSPNAGWSHRRAFRQSCSHLPGNQIDLSVLARSENAAAIGAAVAVGETMAGITRHAAETGQAPAHKLAATAAILRQILAPVGTDLAGLRRPARPRCCCSASQGRCAAPNSPPSGSSTSSRATAACA